MLASGYSRCQMVLDVLFVFAKMKDFNIRASIILYNNLLYKMRNTDIIRDVCDDIKASGIHPSEYNNSILIDGLCKQFLMQEAVEFHRGTECRELGPCVVSFNTLMSSSCKMGYLDVAELFFCMMFKYGLHLTVHSYNILIHGLSMAGVMEEALEFKGDMEKYDVEPKVVTYNILAKGFCLLVNVYEGIKLREEYGATSSKNIMRIFFLLRSCRHVFCHDCRVLDGLFGESAKV
uniref:Pentatricopeptide repeat-containing protein At1g13630 isoform X2 n=1 Tax=Nicotiana sylvestris TaxID=4096 RepID=A0A1U7VRE6_NICSY|nr:PREDICTED: putative pentatricopeptide repeat-containing protein At1g13630 isoform X2 [Nicotiana sylvestris]